MIEHIESGKLEINIQRGKERLNELLSFASRENPKRGYLFVSKVLGKHIPVHPKKMRAIYDQMADMYPIDSDTLVIGMAETATGLGAGFSDSLARKNPDFDVFYQHTTRHQIEAKKWFELDEIHSHAVDHILYEPSSDILNNVKQVTKLILVDDEMSTGRTLLRLADKLTKEVKNIEEIVIFTLVNWLDESKLEKFENFHVPVKFRQLLKGDFSFIPDDSFSAVLPEHVDKDICLEDSRDDLGRTGLKMPYQLSQEDISYCDTLDDVSVIVGTGEHLYYPFLLAEHLNKDKDIYFQSTTRSPILKGGPIKHKIHFEVGDNRVNFIYNLPESESILVCHETEQYQGLNGLVKSNENKEINKRIKIYG